MVLRWLALALGFPLVGCVSAGIESTEATSSADTVDDAARHLRANVTGLTVPAATARSSSRTPS